MERHCPSSKGIHLGRKKCWGLSPCAPDIIRGSEGLTALRREERDVSVAESKLDTFSRSLLDFANVRKFLHGNRIKVSMYGKLTPFLIAAFIKKVSKERGALFTDLVVGCFKGTNADCRPPYHGTKHFHKWIKLSLFILRFDLSHHSFFLVMHCRQKR